MSAPWRREQRAYPAIVQPKSSPKHGCDVDGEQGVREKRIPDPQVAGDGAAQVSGPENRAKWGSPKNQVQGEANELNEADGKQRARRITELRSPFNGGRQREHFDSGVKSQKQDGETTQGTAGP